MEKQNQDALYDGASVRINLKALAANYTTLAKLNGGTTAAVVKADAYGLGVEAVAPVLAAAGCSNFFVAQLAEGLALRQILPDANIYILNGIAAYDVAMFTKNNLIPCLISLEQIKRWQPTGAPAALMLDIDFNRLGLDAVAVAELAQNTKLFDGWELKLIVGHLACSDNNEHAMNRAQLESFNNARAMLPQVPASLANSGGVILGKEFHLDMARVGIALYGGIENEHCQSLQTCATLAAPLLQLRHLSQGDSVGYGGDFVASHEMTIGIVALGYADGVPHNFGTQTPPPRVWLGGKDGQPAAICGRISMDTLAIDLTDYPSTPAIGELVEVFGEHNTLPTLAAAANTSAYELLTRLGKRVKRLYV